MRVFNWVRLALPEYPFYADRIRVDAGDLSASDTIVSFDGDKSILANGTVTNVERVAEPQMMYNLTVDEAHTFFVGEGEWLVHNTNSNCFVTLGNNSNGFRNITKGRLKGYLETVTDQPGGLRNAEDAFEALTGTRPTYTDPTSKAPVATWTGEGYEIYFRPNSATGTPVVEVIDHGGKTFEKIHFNP